MTTIQRLYSLPNCSLMLEGFSDNFLLNSSEFRPLLSILINAECRLARLEKPLSGGREFLDSLVAVVSQYAQEFLSGLHATRLPKQAATGIVQLERVNANTHRLSVRSPMVLDGSTSIIAPSPIEIDLSTVELFDLVEAIDQLLADTKTLPDLSLSLKPLSRKEIVKTEPVTKQVVPGAIGLASLAAAAFAFSLLPVPKVEAPKDLYPVRSSATTNSLTPATPASPTATSQPTPVPSAVSSSPSPSPVADLRKLETALVTAPEITDSATLEQLNQQLRGKIEQRWTTKSTLPQALIYQVGVGKDGTILGYKPVDAAALDNAAKTPLLDLVARQGDRPAIDPLARFKVVFTPSGSVEVTPWKQLTTSPITGITEITESAKLEAILPKLRTQINQSWATAPNFSEDLIYKVRVKEDGTVVDYSAENDAAARYAQETPLSKLGKLIADSSTTTVQEPLALYKVVFTSPKGAVEISPWRGWQN